MRKSVAALLFGVLAALFVPGVAHAAVVPATPYGIIQPLHDFKCLDDPNFSTANNMYVDQWDCVNQTNEGWRVEEPVAGSAHLHKVWIRNQYSKKCLTVLGGSTGAGADVVQYTCTTSNTNGLWWVSKWNSSTYGTYYDFQNVNSNLVLNISGGSTANGALLIQWPWRAAALNNFFKFPYDLGAFT
jgi:cytochrome c